MAPKPSDPVPPLARGDGGHWARPWPICKPFYPTRRVPQCNTRLTPSLRAPLPFWCWRMARLFWGRGFGANTNASDTNMNRSVGEVCFSTGMTGYQETLTDPSFAGQIITFTFPHIGNVGTNAEDIEATTIAARGLVVKQDITEPSNWRSTQKLEVWLRAQGITGIAGVDTRTLTIRIRDGGAPTGVLAFPPDGGFDLNALRAQAADWPGLEGMDLAKEVTCRQTYSWDETAWSWPIGFGRQSEPKYHVVAVDYGAKQNILRCLASAGCRVTVVPATAHGRRHTAAQAGRRVPVERPWRSGRDRRLCGARAAGGAR